MALGYFAVVYSLAEVSAKQDPQRAHALMPNNGRIAARLAEQRFLKKPTGDEQAPTARLARLALKRDATAVSAVATLGFQAQLRGDVKEARRLFAYSQQLTRRDLQTQFWAVEDAIARNDIPGALQHYDIALRTSLVAPDLMFPILAGALTDPTIRTNLVATLAKRPPWGPRFLAYALGNQGDPQSIMHLLVELRRAGVPISPEVSASVINRLVLANAMQDAWRYYASVSPGADRFRSRDPAFTANLAQPSPFDWTAVNEDGIVTSIQSRTNEGLFDFNVRTQAEGVLLRQTQILPPGVYQIEGRSGGIQQPYSSLPYWVLTCRNGSELGRVTVPNSAQNGGIFKGQFTVPAACPVQILALVARPVETIGGISGQIHRVQLSPVR